MVSHFFFQNSLLYSERVLVDNKAIIFFHNYLHYRSKAVQCCIHLIKDTIITFFFNYYYYCEILLQFKITFFFYFNII